MTYPDYPTEAQLDQIRNAPPGEVLGLARALWSYPDYWTRVAEDPGVPSPPPDFEFKYWHEVSTGGWSGNESIIYAMKANTLFWSMHWEQSVRGGHYRFRETP